MLRLLIAASLTFTVSPAAQGPRGQTTGMLLSTAELANRLQDPDLVLVHVADWAEAFEEAHIPAARFLRYLDFAVDGPDGVGSELPPVDLGERL